VLEFDKTPTITGSVTAVENISNPFAHMSGIAKTACPVEQHTNNNNDYKSPYSRGIRTQGVHTDSFFFLPVCLAHTHAMWVFVCISVSVYLCGHRPEHTQLCSSTVTRAVLFCPCSVFVWWVGERGARTHTVLGYAHPKYKWNARERESAHTLTGE
jgi:hypothetical protein